MGLLDFIIKKRQAKKMKGKMEKTNVHKKGKKKMVVKKKTVEKKKSNLKVTKKIEKKVTKETEEKKDHLSLSEAKELLLKLKAEILNAVSLRDSSENILQREELFDEADLAIEERQKELSLMLNEREKIKLKEIDKALERIENKSYGFCEECGDPIPAERLRYLPHVSYCVNCQEKIEREKEIESSGYELERTIVPPTVSESGDTDED